MRIQQKDGWHDFLSDYDYTANLGRDRWAWEWLRRNPDFRKAAFAHPVEDISTRETCYGIRIRKLRAAQPEAEAFGLAYFPNPDLGALRADVIWSRKTYPRPVCVQVISAEAGAVDEIFQRTVRKCHITHFTDAEDHQHLLLRGAGCVLQVRVEGLPLVTLEPREMKLILDEFADWERYVKVLKRAVRVYGDDDTSTPQWSQKALQARNALICIDAADAGLTKLQMAEIIYGADRVREERNSKGRKLKDAMRRYCAKGEEMRAGGYVELLSSLPE